MFDDFILLDQFIQDRLDQVDGAAVVLFHRTTEEAAHAILSAGFKDATGDYGGGIELSGVWLSDRPVDCNEGAKGDVLLTVTLDVSLGDLMPYEWVEEGKPFREWQIPADFLTQHTLCLKNVEVEPLWIPPDHDDPDA